MTQSQVEPGPESSLSVAPGVNGGSTTSPRPASASEFTPYSPSQTLAFLRCPRLWWRSKTWMGTEEWTPNRLLGLSIGAGLDASRTRKPDPEAEALRVLREQPIPVSEWTPAGLQTHVRRGLGAALSKDVLDEGTIVASQLDLGDCIPDLVFREPTGRLVVHDDKVHLRFDTRWEHREIESRELFWQLLHNAWRVSAHFGELVVAVQSLHIGLTPSYRAVLSPRVSVQDSLEPWLEDAKKVWQLMDRKEDYPNYGGCTKYNRPCEFYDGCHVLHGDESKWVGQYTRKIT